MEEPKKNNYTLTGIVAVIVLAVISYGAFKYIKKDSNNTAENPITPTPVAPTPGTEPTPPITSPTTRYKDGSYSAIGHYFSPGGDEELDVSVTLKEDVITSATVKSKATRPNSVRFQGIFVENYKPLVIGKKIDEVQLDKVSGSSLAPKGFNDALAQIKTQAKV